MSFLVLLLVLLVEKFSSWRSRVQRDGWWLGWLDTVGGVKSLVAQPGSACWWPSCRRCCCWRCC